MTWLVTFSLAGLLYFPSKPVRWGLRIVRRGRGDDQTILPSGPHSSLAICCLLTLLITFSLAGLLYFPSKPVRWGLRIVRRGRGMIKLSYPLDPSLRMLTSDLTHGIQFDCTSLLCCQTEKMWYRDLGRGGGDQAIILLNPTVGFRV